MKTIIIKTQAELDALPNSFNELTPIEVRSEESIVIKTTRDNSRVYAYNNSQVYAYNNSQVYAYNNSQVYAYNNSQVTAYNNSQVYASDSSQVTAFLLSTLFVFSNSVIIKSLSDNAHLIYKSSNCQRPLKQDLTVKITEYEEIVIPSFEQWLERGYVVADGINQRFLSQKTIGEVTIFEVTDLFGNGKSFVAKKGDKFAHGETIEKAKADLRYKISDRDTSKYKYWKMEDIKPLEQLIEAYMAITGACSMGIKMFCEETEVNDGEISIEMAIDLTKGRYGNEVFAGFFNKAENVIK